MNCMTFHPHLNGDAAETATSELAALRAARARLPAFAALVIAVASSLVMTFAG